MTGNSLPLDKNCSILIIGAGTFGISTAYHLAKRGYSDITCIDRHPYPSVDSAGFDLNKIIRTEYDESLYVALALEALEAWRHPQWAGIFHETGRLTTTAGNKRALEYLRKSYENLVRADQAHKAELVRGKDQIERLVPQLKKSSNIDHRWKGLFNAQGGWAHSRKALEKWGLEAQQMGVKYISGCQGTMTGLRVDERTGALLGITVASGDILNADRYILTTGAASPEVLPELAPQLWSKCWTLAHIELTEEELAQWSGIPVIDHFELGFTFEPDAESRRMKICDNNPGYQYRAGYYTDDSGNTTRISIPRYASAHPQDGIPPEAEAAIHRLIDTIMPQFSGRRLVDARVCWCADTPDGHWLIDKHPKHSSLLLATGDSGHAFKMFPIIGNYIVDALEGRPTGLRKEWRYGNRKSKAVSTRPDAEVRDLRDALGLEEKHRL